MIVFVSARYFVVRWLDDASLKYDTVQSKDVIPPDESSDVLHLSPGTQCKARFQGKEFGVEIIATGEFCAVCRFAHAQGYVR